MTDHPRVPVLDETIHLVMNDFGDLGCAYVESDTGKADIETIIADLIAGKYSAPARVTAFNVAEGWARDASEDVAREVWQRTTGQTLPQATVRFIERHVAFPVAVS